MALGFKGQIITFFESNNWKLKKENPKKLIFGRIDDERIIEVTLKSKNE